EAALLPAEPRRGPGGDRRRPAGRRPGLPRPADPDGDAVAARRRHRHPRPRPRRTDGGVARPAGGGGQPRRRQRHHRHLGGGEGQAGRLHGPDGHGGHPRHQPGGATGAALRRAARLRAGAVAHHPAAQPLRASLRLGRLAAGVRRAGEGATGAVHLRVLGRGFHRAHGHGAVPAARRHPTHACALPGRGAGRFRPRRGAGAGHLHRAADGEPDGAAGTAALPGHRRGDASAGAARPADLRRVRLCRRQRRRVVRPGGAGRRARRRAFRGPRRGGGSAQGAFRPRANRRHRPGRGGRRRRGPRAAHAERDRDVAAGRQSREHRGGV
ncbi:MAG: BUG/TctC family periplasmic protein, partial [uncultured Acetobacteraceae bacterium]